MFKAYTLPPVTFAFRDNICRPDRFRGLQELGPFQRPTTNGPPKFGFVFPSGYREQANRLFLALKNGLGHFRGVENAFRFPLQKDQVFPVTGFSIQKGANPKDTARIYADAVLSWTKRNSERPDMFFVLHPRTSKWEQESPYYQCKALLLQEGLLSQDVTFELLNDRSKFEWSVANIALAAFVKLGGIPWIVSGEDSEQDLIIGIGSASLYDPEKRQRTRFIGFTACFSARGVFKFVSLANVAQSREEYLAMLENVVSSSLEKAEQLGSSVTSLTLHVPKEMGWDETASIEKAVKKHTTKHLPQISVVKITDESNFFIVDEQSSEGVPRRGTVSQVSDEDYMLYTEGREENLSWRYRMPTALHITPQGPHFATQQMAEVIRQIYDLSQVNWRGFNAQSRPISILYGGLIANILSHVPVSEVENLYQDKARKSLEERMWFL